MDAFNLLKEDHRKVEELFNRLESSRGQAKLRVFEQIKMELDMHTHIEEKIFYPALEKPRETKELALEAYEEHDVVKNLLRQLSRAKTADEEWEAQAKVLRENVEHHVEEEENELFTKADAALGEEEIEELGELMAAEKNRKQSRARGASKRASGKKSAGGKKSASSSKTASKTQSASRAAKRTGSKGAKKGGSKKGASKSRSGSKKSAAKKR